jgi:capsid portal protein
MDPKELKKEEVVMDANLIAIVGDKSRTTKEHVLVPFQKSESSTSFRGLSFDTKKQRNAKAIQKGLSKPGSISYDTLRRAAASVAVVRICVNVLKEKITKTKWMIKSIDPLVKPDKDKVDEVTELFKHPNGNDETFRTLLDKMLEDLLVLDSVSVEKTRYQDGSLAELHYVDAATIRPVFDEYGNQDVLLPINSKKDGLVDLPVSYIQVLDNSEYGGPESGEIKAYWSKKDFLYFHLHPQGAMENFGYGLSPIESVIGVVSNILSSDNFNSSYFEEGGFPPLILNLKGQMNQPDLDALKEYIYSELLGSFHRPAIMAGAEGAEVINLKDINNRDMQFMEYTLFLSRLLAAAYGLSGQDIGLVDDLNKATSQVQQNVSEEKGYGSILHLLKEIFNQEIVWKDFGYTDLEFEWVVDDRTDPQTLATITDTRLKNGTLTINEVRTKNGDLPYSEEWADVPMILNSSGEYKKLAPTDIEESKDIDEPGNEKPYKEQDKIEKSIRTIDGYKTWMDDRGYSQPFICMNILTNEGFVIKPPVAVNLTSQNLEIELSQKLVSMGLNVPLVQKVPINELAISILRTDSVKNEFDGYMNMLPAYDSEKWRARQGGSRKFDYYLVSNYIYGYSLTNPLLLKDMKRDPKSYEEAIKDLAKLWLVEKEMILGDRRANQYIISPIKRAWGIDYQFKGDIGRYDDNKMDVAKVLIDIPQLYDLYMKEIGEKSFIKSIKSLIKK